MTHLLEFIDKTNWSSFFIIFQIDCLFHQSNIQLKEHRILTHERIFSLPFYSSILISSTYSRQNSDTYKLTHCQ
jgi:hypothetical protein